MEVEREQAETWASWFRALGDPSRILILNLLATSGRPMSVGEIVDELGLAQSTVSHHLKILGEVGFALVEREVTVSWWRVNERCLACFPSAAEVVMGRVPAGAAPWNESTATGEEDTMNEPSDVEAEVRRLLRRAPRSPPATARRRAAGREADRFGAGLYDDLDGLPDAATLASIGCGNPVAVADLHPGEVVLDLGSGGGIDVLLSARRVGPTGRAYGVDFTPEMLDLARRNAADAGATNVEFLEGRIDAVPLPDASVDVIISNCVVNLAVDKAAVFTEMHRLLVPGGRIGVSDVVTEDRLTPAERAERGSYVGCIAGALAMSDYRSGLEAAGLTDVSIECTHAVGDGVHAAIIRATKPLPDPSSRRRRRGGQDATCAHRHRPASVVVSPVTRRPRPRSAP